MPVFRLTRQLAFPDPELAEDGLLAVGGDLSVGRLMLAYRHGIFPWYSEGEPILWWSPDPRMVIVPQRFHTSKRLLRVLKQQKFRFTLDTVFADVIRGCAETRRRHERGTWITPDMIEAYVRLHEAGYAHSVEAWQEETLAGGLYGLSFGACFFGESMFTRATDASKAALTAFVHQCVRWDIQLIDCQLPNPHLRRLGALEMPRHEYLRLLESLAQRATLRGSWRFDEDLAASAFRRQSDGLPPE